MLHIQYFLSVTGFRFQKVLLHQLQLLIPRTDTVQSFRASHEASAGLSRCGNAARSSSSEPHSSMFGCVCGCVCGDGGGEASLSDEQNVDELQHQHSSATARIHHRGQVWSSGAAGPLPQTGMECGTLATAGQRRRPAGPPTRSLQTARPVS